MVLYHRQIRGLSVLVRSSSERTVEIIRAYEHERFNTVLKGNKMIQYFLISWLKLYYIFLIQGKMLQLFKNGQWYTNSTTNDYGYSMEIYGSIQIAKHDD